MRELQGARGALSRRVDAPLDYSRHWVSEMIAMMAADGAPKMPLLSGRCMHCDDPPCVTSCPTGSMLRMGEAHLKLWAAVLFFSWIGSIFSAIAKQTGLMLRETDLDLMVDTTKVGYQAYITEMIGGWGWVYLLSFGMLAFWYVLVRYNESTEKFTVL